MEEKFMDFYLEKTKLLDFEDYRIQALIRDKGWIQLNDYEKILGIYNFIRDDIQFGYNIDDNIPASMVLQDGYGQCNTKGILFMALLRTVNIPCRIHGFTIDKKLQKGALKGIYYILSPKEIVHSWVEIFYDSKWLNIEGFILDRKYLGQLQEKFSNCSGSFCGYGVATTDFKNPQIYWNKNNTYIQKEGIVKDFGIFNNPDELFAKHSQALSVLKKYLYKNFIRNLMNKNIESIRESKFI
jgi:hypothetical protein